MTMPPLPAEKSVHRKAFEHYLRTGERLTNVEWLEREERKFNPYHDERGRFTSQPGVTVSWGKYRSSGTRFAGDPAPASTADNPRSADVSNSTNSAFDPRQLEARFDGAFQKPRAKKLGTLSAKYETGGRGVGTVSSGTGRNGTADRGGVSYGSYQLTSQTLQRDKDGNVVILKNGGNVARFLRTEGEKWAQEFAGLKPGSKEFSDVWLRISRSDGAALHAAEHAWVKRNNYDPAVKLIGSATQLNVDDLPLVLKDVVWSTAVQHGSGSLKRSPGGAARIVVDAVSATDATVSRTSPGYAEELVKNIYIRRTAYWPSDRPRYKAELQNALQRLRTD